ncbi:DEAD/DEAH box helicase [Salisediminibacterium selenitireducens]|uniref:ATP-dependent RNA helicase DbpA n=1 Tax=Bacillus selenitireducens (strain ATCC 700615 / DSM 15326 / MLS10) TaxID=439292 RepID=D6XWF6_BACIE|nr:DEAD/DEAH box helicase [Salisediminibacterium selenitireducens]ADH97798.1 DEAD/DEAH box helicase domain protein [[Bacillus] selenitireducens MLS10]
MTHDSFQAFGLSDEIVRALNELNMTMPTDVQKQVIPLAMENKDVLVTSQTGTGKTASYAIPICDTVDWEENRPQALILSPTRELAVQIQEDITNIGRFRRIKATALYGQEPVNKQKLELKQKTHVVVGTPGRVLDHIKKGTLMLNRIEHLVIDEADQMLDMGFIDQVEAILASLPKERTTSLFSATMRNEIRALAGRHMNAPDQIAIKQETVAADTIDQSVIHVTNKEKLQLLQDVTVVENPDSCLIFCNTQESVDLLETSLNKEGYRARKIHGGLPQKERFSVMEAFKRGSFRYLIATNVAARGIDIDSVSLVINYDVPFEKESYVHRTGRTGRAGKAGKAITFVNNREKSAIRELERYTGIIIPLAKAPSPDEVKRARNTFYEKLNTAPVRKEKKSANLNKEIMTLYVNGGKKKKLRAPDFVGTLTSIDGIDADDIGIITIQETSTTIDIFNGKGPLALKELKERTVKGKRLKVREARNRS